MESLGSLRIGNPIYHVQRHSTNETFNRQVLTEKLPRGFVLHEPTKPKKNTQDMKIKKSDLSKLEKFCAAKDIPRWALAEVNSIPLSYFPSVPLLIIYDNRLNYLTQI